MSLPDDPLAAVSLAELASTQPEISRQINLLRQAVMGSSGLLERGSATLANGEATIPSSFVSSRSLVQVFYIYRDGITGVDFEITDVVEGESFTIRSSSCHDNSEVGYLHFAL